jgi:hypothetical protein
VKVLAHVPTLHSNKTIAVFVLDCRTRRGKQGLPPLVRTRKAISSENVSGVGLNVP